MWAALGLNCRQGIDGPWILEDDSEDEDGNNRLLVGENFEWNSDDDIEDRHEESNGYIYFLGFHA